MNNLKQRYLEGDCDAVCCELNQLDNPWEVSDATWVADEIVSRCRQNLSLLGERLIAMGYRFSNPECYLVLTGESQRRELRGFKSRVSGMPMLLSAWYNQIWSVDFSQSPDQIFKGQRTSANSSAVSGLGYNCELYLNNPLSALDGEIRAPVSGWGRNFDEEGRVKFGRENLTFLATGGYASNGDPRGIFLPDVGFDGCLFNDGGGETTFREYLKFLFSWVGFPFWARLGKRNAYIPNEVLIPDYELLKKTLGVGMLSI